MVGSFSKVFLGILAVLFVPSDALKCHVNSSGNNPYLASMAKLAPALMNVKEKEHCDGMCIYGATILTKPGEATTNYEIAGCADVPSEQAEQLAKLEGFVGYFAISMDKGQSGGLTCATDNCNSDANPENGRIRRIGSILDEEIPSLKVPRSRGLLKCHTDSGSDYCLGSCMRSSATVLERHVVASLCVTDISTDRIDYGIFAVGLYVPENGLMVSTSVICSTDNCNAPGSAADRILEKVERRLKPELPRMYEAKPSREIEVPRRYEARTSDRRFSSAPNEYSAIIFISIIMTIVHF